MKKLMLSIAVLASLLPATQTAAAQEAGKMPTFDAEDPLSCIAAQEQRVPFAKKYTSGRMEFYSCDNGRTLHAVVTISRIHKKNGTLPISLGIVDTVGRLKSLGKKRLEAELKDHNARCVVGTPIIEFKETDTGVCALVCGNLFDCASKHYALREDYRHRFMVAKALSQHR